MSLWSYGHQEGVDSLKELQQPRLDRDACLSQKGIRSFLKLSRLASDDTLKQHLNNILDNHDRVIRKSDNELCHSFITEYIFPQWQSRLKMISFCDNEALKLKQEIDKTAVRYEEKIVDPRVDPYYERSSKDEIAEQYSRYNQLFNWIQNEKDIELIVEDRSVEILTERCNLNHDLKREFTEFQKK